MSRHTTLETKTRAKSLRTWEEPAIRVVSVYHACSSLAVSSLDSVYHQSLEPGYSYTGPSGDDNGNLCKCSTVMYSLISACDACQGEELDNVRIQHVSYSRSSLMGLPSAGLNTRSTARLSFLFHREITVAA
jgi:hypothetical protein